MPEANHILSFSTDAAGDQLFVHADAAGLDFLIRSLTHLREKLAQGVSDHDHLMSPAWGGHQLSQPPLSAGDRVIDHVKVWAWTPAEIREHRLDA